MVSATMCREPTERLLLAGLFTLLLAVGLVLAPGTASTAQAARSNSGQGTCVKGYNYAEPSTSYLFASSEVFGDCAYAAVVIINEGAVLGGGSGPGFEGSWCTGQQVLASNSGFSYTSTSVTHDIERLRFPCSGHYGEDWWYGVIWSQGGLYFSCSHVACW